MLLFYLIHKKRFDSRINNKSQPAQSYSIAVIGPLPKEKLHCKNVSKSCMSCFSSSAGKCNNCFITRWVLLCHKASALCRASETNGMWFRVDTDDKIFVALQIHKYLQHSFRPSVVRWLKYFHIFFIANDSQTNFPRCNFSFSDLLFWRNNFEHSQTFSPMQLSCLKDY